MHGTGPRIHDVQSRPMGLRRAGSPATAWSLVSGYGTVRVTAQELDSRVPTPERRRHLSCHELLALTRLVRHDVGVPAD